MALRYPTIDQAPVLAKLGDDQLWLQNADTLVAEMRTLYETPDGNCVVLYFANTDPLTCAQLAELLEQTGIPRPAARQPSEEEHKRDLFYIGRFEGTSGRGGGKFAQQLADLRTARSMLQASSAAAYIWVFESENSLTPLVENMCVNVLAPRRLELYTFDNLQFDPFAHVACATIPEAMYGDSYRALPYKVVSQSELPVAASNLPVCVLNLRLPRSKRPTEHSDPVVKMLGFADGDILLAARYPMGSTQAVARVYRRVAQIHAPGYVFNLQPRNIPKYVSEWNDAMDEQLRADYAQTNVANMPKESVARLHVLFADDADQLAQLFEHIVKHAVQHHDFGSLTDAQLRNVPTAIRNWEAGLKNNAEVLLDQEMENRNLADSPDADQSDEEVEANEPEITENEESEAFDTDME